MTGRRQGHGNEGSYMQTCPQGGRRKLCYWTKQEAKRHARSGVLGVRLRVYRCSQCGWWHVTSQEKKRKPC